MKAASSSNKISLSSSSTLACWSLSLLWPISFCLVQSASAPAN